MRAITLIVPISDPMLSLSNNSSAGARASPINSRRWPAPQWSGGVLLVAMAICLRWGYALLFPPDVQLQDVDARGYH